MIESLGKLPCASGDSVHHFWWTKPQSSLNMQNCSIMTASLRVIIELASHPLSPLVHGSFTRLLSQNNRLARETIIMVLGKNFAVSALEVTSRSTELELSAPLLWVILRACEVDSRTEWVWLL